ncbi:hypothetical protein Sya03_31320 [Spirilliplanes yamanashiensis]|uniref:Uncharacterized protein n=1 Tax=Spirilliplanes yamanashiensis TaxID=42233 RepID=A0A8J4DK79_9ACTN|nr:hypothetical protein Sya03_31320 [Spirilliplanes yamanashiensis]
MSLGHGENAIESATRSTVVRPPDAQKVIHRAVHRAVAGAGRLARIDAMTETTFPGTSAAAPCEPRGGPVRLRELLVMVRRRLGGSELLGGGPPGAGLGDGARAAAGAGGGRRHALRGPAGRRGRRLARRARRAATGVAVDRGSDTVAATGVAVDRRSDAVAATGVAVNTRSDAVPAQFPPSTRARTRSRVPSPCGPRCPSVVRT